jgi:hypothetical protein
MARGVTYRLDVRKQDRTVELELHGLLDPPALAALRVALEHARSGGAEVRIVLAAGTDVERSCVAELRALRAEVVARAPYLAAWIAAGTKD